MPSSRLDIRLTDEEKQIISEKAKALSMSLSDYIRFVSVNAEIKVSVKVKKDGV